MKKISDKIYTVIVGFPETNGQVSSPITASSAHEAIKKAKKSYRGYVSRRRLAELTFSAEEKQ